MTAFLDRFAPWERRFSRKFRVELIHRMNEILQERGFTQKDVAERAGWKESYVSRLLNGEQNMTLKSIARFEEAVDSDIVVIPLADEQFHLDRSLTRVELGVVEPLSRRSNIDLNAILDGIENTRTTLSVTMQYYVQRSAVTALHENEAAHVS